MDSDKLNVANCIDLNSWAKLKLWLESQINYNSLELKSQGEEPTTWATSMTIYFSFSLSNGNIMHRVEVSSKTIIYIISFYDRIPHYQFYLM